MKKILLPLALSLIFASCSFNTIESDDPVPVTLNLEAGDSKAPGGLITWTGLSVSGPDMTAISLDSATITAAMNATGKVTLNVPPGNSRTFSLTASTANQYYSGVLTINIAAESTPSLTIPMKFARSNILIPDRYNSRLVQISGITGTGWIEQGTATDPKDTIFSLTNEPASVDYDNYGNIYVQTMYDYGEGVDNYIYKSSSFTGTGTIWEELAGPLYSYPAAVMHVEKDTGYVYVSSNYDEVSGNYGDYIMVILPDGSYGTSLNVQDLVTDLYSFYEMVFLPLGGGTIAVAYIYTDSVPTSYAVVEVLKYSGGSNGTWTQISTPATDTGTIYSSFYDASFSALKSVGNSIFLVMEYNYWNGPTPQEEFRSVQYNWDGTAVTHVPLPDESAYYSYVPDLASTVSYEYMRMFNDGTSRLYFYATQVDSSTSTAIDYVLQFQDPTFSQTEIPVQYGSTGTSTGEFHFYNYLGAY